MKKAILSISLLFFFSVSFGQTAKKLVKSGMDKYYDADFKGAIDDFTKAIALDSNFVDAYSSRGYAKNKLEDYQGAIADFSKSILLDPKDVNNFLMRAKIRYGMLDYKEAINDYTKGIELYPEFYSLYLYRAKVKYDSTDYKGAIADYTKSIELNLYYKNHGRLGEINPLQTNNSTGLDYADAFYFRGLSKKNIKDYKGAIYDFTHVLEINLRVFYSETDFESKVLYETTGYQLNKSATAKLIEKSWPNLVDAIYQRGLSNYELKFYEEAAADFTNVINLSPNNAYAYLYRGISNYLLKNYYSTQSNCYDDYTKAIQLKPDLTEAYYYRGLLINEGYSMNNYEDAYEDFSKALLLDPKFAEAYLNRGIHMFKNRSRPDRESFTIDEIVDNYDKAIALKSFFPDAYFHRGIAKNHFDKKDYAGAIADFTKAIEQNPNFMEAYQNRSFSYNYLSQNGNACLDMKKAIELGGTYLHDILKTFCK